MIECPSCKGKKYTLAHINYGDGQGEWKHIPCYCCEGTGEITDEQVAWHAEGRRIRQERLQMVPFVSIANRAAQLGLTTVQYSQMEMGKIKPYTLSEGGAK